ncbi:MAG: O-acetyl-ADP-ribose deacetylase [Anaerovoracaceae bacterium]|jgi:O-acetyl-ADP-ribose deacetylase (regulator of RNase III)
MDKEAILNMDLKEAIQAFIDNSTEEVFNNLMTVICIQAAQGAECVIPVEVGDGMKEKLDALPDNGELTLEREEDLDVMMKSVEGDNGKDLLVVFTSQEEADKGEDTSTLSVLLYDFLSQACDAGDSENAPEGIIIDPWSESLFLPMDLVRSLVSTIEDIIEDDEEIEEGDIMLVQSDITKLDVECIVNAANNTLLGGGGVDGAIHRAAGPELQEECRRLHGCKTGEAKITYGYDLPCEYVIHTVGPIYSGKYTDKKLLEDCYWNSLSLAREHGIHSIAFPSISTGVFGYPIEKAVETAVPTVLDWLGENDDYDMKVIFCCYDDETYHVYQDYLDETMEKADEDDDDDDD